MSHSDCHCDCCDIALNVGDLEAPDGQLTAEYLNGHRSLVEAGPLALQEFAGTGFVKGAGDLFHDGTLTFANVLYEEVFVAAVADTARGLAVDESLLPAGILLVQSTPPAGGSVSIGVFGVTATAEYTLASMPRVVTATQDKYPFIYPFPAINFGTNESSTLIKGDSIFSEDALYFYAKKTLRLGSQKLRAVDWDNFGYEFLTRASQPLRMTLTAYQTTGETFVTAREVNELFFQGSNDLFVEQPTSETGYRGRVVVERNGTVVLDEVRPTFETYNQAIEPDGSYLVTRFYGAEYSPAYEGVLPFPSNAETIGPPSNLTTVAQPSRRYLVFANDSSAPVLGFVPPDDFYADETAQMFDVLMSTKPLESYNLADEQPDGLSTRPFYGFDFVFSDGPSLAAARDPGTYTIQFDDTSLSEYADENDNEPAQLPSWPVTVHAVPEDGKGPRPSLSHPVLASREQFRPLAAEHAVAEVRLQFSESVDIKTVAAEQITFTVNGQTVNGCTVEHIAGETDFLIAVPAEAQTPGAFCVLEYAPGGSVVSRESSRPSVVTARTAWLMQASFFRPAANPSEEFVIGRVHSLSESVSQSPPDAGIELVYDGTAGFAESDITPIVRQASDGFVPRVSSASSEAETCSYFGMNTTIHPAEPAYLNCPAPKAAQPHNSAFAYGGGASSVTLSVQYFNDETGQQTTPLTWEEADAAAGENSGVVQTEFFFRAMSAAGSITLANSVDGVPLQQNTYASHNTFTDLAIIYGQAEFAEQTLFSSYNLLQMQCWLSAFRQLTQYTDRQTAFAHELVLRLYVQQIHQLSESYDNPPEGWSEPTFPVQRTQRIFDFVLRDDVEQGGVAYWHTNSVQASKQPLLKLSF